MKACIWKGKLILVPETDTEVYALQQWENKARFKVVDHERMEDSHVKGSSVVVLKAIEEGIHYNC